MSRKTIINAMGFVLIGFGVIILLPVIVAVVEKEYGSILPFVVTSAFSVILGLVFRWRGGWVKNFDNMKRVDGLIIVVLTWIVTAFIGAIPYLFYDLSPLDACFESVSGLTTTGATILTDFSRYPKDFFFWRSLSQWIGGMGIIVLFIAILPQFAVAGRGMFFAEAPGPTEDKITPRITHTAKSLWLVYVFLTIMEVVLLCAAGMPPFDALCNSLSTMAAGGFSPHPQSIMGYNNSAVVWIVTFFMFLAGSNFALQYRALIQRRPRSLLGNEEFRLYAVIVVILSCALGLFLVFDHHVKPIDGLRDGLFQIVSIITTTGFSSADFALWVVPAQAILMLVMFVGGCAGSAGGGVKVVRILFAAKYLKAEVTRVLHPQATLSVKLDKTSVPPSIQQQMIGFLLFYVVLMIVSGFVITLIEADASIGFIGTAATIGNIGPGFGEIGPMGGFGQLSSWSKGIFIVDMVVGRLELIPFIVLLHPDFWRFE